MDTTDVSIIIPTFNRSETLIKALAALARQSLDIRRYETIIIDDGSNDRTEEAVRAFAAACPLGIRYYRQENRGPAAARNAGIRNAAGRIVLFLGDDSIAAPRLLEEHVAWHTRYPHETAAVLGYVTWSPEIRCTPFMRWCENGGPQFPYHRIKDATEVDASFFFTCNVSLKRSFLVSADLYFDEDFRHAAYEDTELAFRLRRHGMRLFYNRNACAFHYHFTSLESAAKRMIAVGMSEVLFSRKTGQRLRGHRGMSFLADILYGIRFLFFYPVAKFYEGRRVQHRSFQVVMGYFHRIGLQRGLKKYS